MKLYILGNGFDQNHNLSTSYEAYRDFLLSNYLPLDRKAHLPYLFENCKYLSIPKGDRWSDIEESLTINTEKMVNDYLFSFNPQKRVSLESPTYEQEIQQRFLESKQCDLSFLNEIHDFVSTCYYEWIKCINCSNVKPKFGLSNKDIYLTFNYTPTLEEVYDISSSQIFHIHGYCRNIDETSLWGEPHITPRGDVIRDNRCSIILDEIQFGSIRNTPKGMEKELIQKYKDDQLFESFYKPLIEKISAFCSWAYKDLEKNCEHLKTFIECREIEEVIIMGHSLLGVDDLYYENILVPAFRACRWKIYCFDKPAKVSAKEFSEKYKIDIEILKW